MTFLFDHDVQIEITIYISSKNQTINWSGIRSHRKFINFQKDLEKLNK